MTITHISMRGPLRTVLLANRWGRCCRRDPSEIACFVTGFSSWMAIFAAGICIWNMVRVKSSRATPAGAAR